MYLSIFDLGVWPDVTPDVGEQYRLVCTDPSGAVVVNVLIVYSPGVAAAIQQQAAIDLAVARLDPPLPVPHTNPPEGADLLVGLSTWLWVEDFEPWSATATVGSVSSTVTATPVSVGFDPGDGNAPVVCDGPGSPDGPVCAHVYTHRSTAGGSALANPDGTFTLTATVTYRVGWSATTGQSGDLGTLTRSATLALTVREIQAAIN